MRLLRIRLRFQDLADLMTSKPLKFTQNIVTMLLLFEFRVPSLFILLHLLFPFGKAIRSLMSFMRTIKASNAQWSLMAGMRRRK